MNKTRGIYELGLNGKTYKFQLNINALCEAESELNMTMTEFGDKMSMTVLRTVFWAGLHEFDESVDKKLAGEIISETGWLESVEIFTKSLTEALGTGEGKKGRSKKLDKEKNLEGQATLPKN